MTVSQSFEFTNGIFGPLTTPKSPILVADSWLTLNGQTRALDWHRERFLRCVMTQSNINIARRAELFWTLALAQIPAAGGYFPRVDLVGNAAQATLLLHIRQAPSRNKNVRLWSSTHDPRTNPNIKGPDLTALLQTRADAQEFGADEAVILSTNGHVIDGSTSAIMWWRGENLFTPPSDFARVDSITMRCMHAIANKLGQTIAEEYATPAQLNGCEVWAVNALHGIRLVTGWSDETRLNLSNSSIRRLSTWRLQLEGL